VAIDFQDGEWAFDMEGSAPVASDGAATTEEIAVS
jgi:hypothetical protein